jgi:DNA-binding MarR family transcriptional regulator
MRVAQDLPGELVMLLQQFTIEADRFIDVFRRGHSLHRTDLNAVAHIARASNDNRPLTPGELSRLLSLSPAATTALIGRLEAAGHVERVHDTSDRRRVHLEMQPSASALARSFFTPLGQRMRAGMTGYSEEELQLIAGFLTRMTGAVSAAAEDA